MSKKQSDAGLEADFNAAMVQLITPGGRKPKMMGVRPGLLPRLRRIQKKGLIDRGIVCSSSRSARYETKHQEGKRDWTGLAVRIVREIHRPGEPMSNLAHAWLNHAALNFGMMLACLYYAARRPEGVT